MSARTLTFRSPLRYTPILVASAVLIGCESLSQPGDEVYAPDFQIGPVAQSVTGNGELTFLGELRTFSFSAVKGVDGSVTGRFVAFNRGSGNRISGSVTCFTIQGGNAAWIAGVIEQANIDAVGVETGWRAVDNGPAGSPTPDQLSFAVGVENAADFCATTPSPPPPGLQLQDIIAGDIRVNS